MSSPMVTAEMLGQDLVEWAIGLSNRSYELVVEDLTEGHRALSLAQLHRAIETASLALVQVLEGHEQPFALTNDQIMVVRDTARHNFPLRDMIRGLRIVQRHWSGALFDLADACLPAGDRPERLRTMLEVLTSFFDDTIDSVMVEFLSERQRLLACAITDRREMAARVLAGEAAGNASAVLGIDLDQHHLGLVLWIDDQEEARRPYGMLEPLAGQLKAALEATSLLVVPGGEASLWAWVSSEQRPREDYLAVIDAVLGGHPWARAAVGRPGAGLGGFRQGHEDACDALRIAQTGPSFGHVVSFHEVSLVALLGADLARARRFILDELGDLSGRRPPIAELRCTLRSYFEADQSLVKTAAALGLHRNTVVYRLRRIEQLLGHPVSTRTLEVHAALDIVSKLGETVLAS